MYNNEQEIKNIRPDLRLLEALHPYGVAITAPGDNVDFVTRYFAPSYDIPEDPVTGSIYCALTPFWSKHTGKIQLTVKQLSKRGGIVECEEKQDKVLISEYATLYLERYIII